MSYLVLARKWRPRYFDDVVGQEHVARTLKNSIEQDRVAHAYLFCGARGVGKTSTARILAKCLNCEEGPTPEPCYECESCRDITDGQSVDVYEIDGASNRGIDEIRELREGVRYAPSQGRYKIYIIDEVHMLTTEAFNALLKTLEEPPEHAYFIFATTEPQKIPITILSRCQRFDFKRIGQADIVEHLSTICSEEGIEIGQTGLQLIARQAEGAMRDALSLLDQVIGFAGDSVSDEQVADILGVANREHLFAISRAILDRDADSAIEALDNVHRYGYDLQEFASELVTHLRDLTVVAAVDEPASVTNLTESELDEIRDELEAMEVRGDARRQLLHRCFSTMADGARKMTRSPYPKLIFEMTLVRLTQLEPLVDLDLVVDKLDALESEFDVGEEFEAGGNEGADGGGSAATPSSSEGETAHSPGGGQTSTTSATTSASTAAGSGTDRGSDAEVADDRSGQRGGGEGAGRAPDAQNAGGRREQSRGDSSPERSKAGAVDGEPPEVDFEGQNGEPPIDELWEKIVDQLDDPARGKFARTFPRRLDLRDCQVSIGCEESDYGTLFKEGDHGVAAVERAAQAVLGGEWSAELAPWSEHEAAAFAGRTPEARRDAERERRRQSLREDVRQHEVVQRARQLFEVDDDELSVDVELDE
ncbi:MAG: DNA polymerase III subunit gamma/tau [Bradymonadaceae bacterium]